MPDWTDWRTSSRSAMHGECVQWRKSSRSHTCGECVEVATGGVAQVRDSKDPNGPKLTFTDGQWRQFIAGITELRAPADG